jgi:hypothetical protein
MDKNASPKADKTPQTSPEAPFTTFIQLDGMSTVPSQFRTPGTFTITRLQSPAGLPDRITKLSPVPALLVSISLKSLPSSRYQVWTADKLIATSIVHPFRSNVIDFDSQPRCWAGSAFDYVHYSVPRKGLDDIAEDLGFGRVSDYRLAVLEDDLVVAQITKSILPFLGRSDGPSVLARPSRKKRSARPFRRTAKLHRRTRILRQSYQAGQRGNNCPNRYRVNLPIAQLRYCAIMVPELQDTRMAPISRIE